MNILIDETEIFLKKYHEQFIKFHIKYQTIFAN